jgi:hypothetical protein
LPTPTAERRSAGRLWPLLAAGAALVAVAHSFSGEPPDDGEQARARHPVVPSVRSTPEAAPEPKELAGIVKDDPDEAARLVAGALPKTDSAAQRLEVLEIRALVTQGKLGQARARASSYFARWPAGPDVLILEQLTGAHPGD